MEKLMIPVRRWNRLAGASGAQIPFRQAAALRDSRRPCSATQIQSLGAKRKYLHLSSWGAKRARSALGGGDKQPLSGCSLPPPPHTNNRCVHLIHFGLGAKRVRSALGCGGQPEDSIRSIGCGGGNPALSVGALPRPNNDYSTCTPATDWANIGDGPAGLIAEFTLASDVADYIRFRAACRSWRRCSPDPRASGLDSRFLPWRWIMLDNGHASSRRHRFLNVSTGECIRTDLVDLAGHTLLAFAPEGLLLLLHETTLIVRLLDPLTCQLTDLPPVTGLLTPEHHEVRNCGNKLGKLLVYGMGLVADGSKVAVSFCDPRVLAVAKPGDESWTPVDDTHTNMYSTLSFAGRFYCVSYRGVMVLNFSSDQEQAPRLLMVAERSKSFYFSVMADSLHLVDNGGELLLVHRMYCGYGQDQEDDDDGESDDDDTCVRRYEVYRVDLDAGILIPAKGLNEHAVFMGMWRSISVSSASDAFPYVTPNTIYLGVDCDEETREYNVADGSMEPRHYCPFGPHTAVDCLRFCIQDHGTELLA